ncbi:MAG: hypothetical protein AB7I25_03935 [Vicinamibacterales bacterium]
MASPQIVAYSVRELVERPDALAVYDDPVGYLAESGARWTEFLASNPRGHLDDLAIVLAVVGNRVVGNLRAVPVELKAGGTTFRSLALRAFFLDREWRAGGTGGMMLLRMLSSTRSAVASGGPAPETVALYTRAGFITLGPLARFVRFHSTRPLVGMAVRGLPVAPVLSVPLDPLARLYYRVRAPRTGTTLSFPAVRAFSGDLDAVVAGRTGDHVVREARDLNWVLRFSPSLAAHEIRDGGALAGYSLIRSDDRPAATAPRRMPAMRVTSLLDFHLADPQPGRLDQLLRHAEAAADAAGADVLEVQTNRADLISRLRRSGFMHLGGNKVLLRPPAGVAVDPARWQMTEAQGDTIFSALDVSAPVAPGERVP